MIATNDLLAEVGMPFARAHSIQEVARERVERVELLGILKRVVRLESLEARLHFDLGHREAPDCEAGKEEIPVFRRD